MDFVPKFLQIRVLGDLGLEGQCDNEPGFGIPETLNPRGCCSSLGCHFGMRGQRLGHLSP